MYLEYTHTYTYIYMVDTRKRSNLMYLPYTHVNDTCRIKFKNNINKRRIKLDAMKYIIYHAPYIYI